MDGKGIKYEYEKDTISFTVPVMKRRYIPDFKLPNGIYVEAKGNFDRDSRKKMQLVKEQNPDLDIRLLFMRDNYISKKSKTKYSTWCEKHGYTYAVSATGEIPDEWLV